MSNYWRSIILKKVARLVDDKDNICRQKIIRQLRLRSQTGNGMYSFILPLHSKDYDIKDKIGELSQNDFKDTFESITLEKHNLAFNVSRDKYVKKILENNHSNVTPPLLIDSKKNIIVEFSSPNIAKPFHLGHLRSTIIGNYIANINNFLLHNVKTINYLGDWGTQFGFIHLGMELGNIDEKEMKTNPIKVLYNAYVTSNKLAKTDPSINEKAKKIFQQLEIEGNNSIQERWEIFKNYTAEELKKTYKRLNINFDEYHWESMYNANRVKPIIALMEEMRLLQSDKENRIVVPVDTYRNIPVIKSDGSTLYITRDIAAAIDRYQKYNFDLMYYVVDNSQTDHFSSLVKILDKMEMSWAKGIKHVKFGRIRGMSTRDGTAVFLEDILDEMRRVMREKQMQSPTTKVPLHLTDNSADILGISAVVINDLKTKRQKDYIFDWDTTFNVHGKSGIRLQYAHCRLVNLELNSGASLVAECDPSLLKEQEVDDLITLIGKFDETIIKSYQDFEPYVLTAYLFDLSDYVNKAIKKLRIKGQSSDVGSQRLLLFRTAKNIFAQGLKLLGVTPLNTM